MAKWTEEELKERGKVIHNLKEVMKQKKLSQTQILGQLNAVDKDNNFSKGYLSKVLSGKEPPADRFYNTAIVLLNQFNVTSSLSGSKWEGKGFYYEAKSSEGINPKIISLTLDESNVEQEKESYPIALYFKLVQGKTFQGVACHNTNRGWYTVDFKGEMENNFFLLFFKKRYSQEHIFDDFGVSIAKLVTKGGDKLVGYSLSTNVSDESNADEVERTMWYYSIERVDNFSIVPENMTSIFKTLTI